MAAKKTLALSALGFGAVALAQLQQCGNAWYNTTQYVCDDNEYLCPIIAGEGLSYCNGACYSTFMYTCSNNVLTLLPALPAGTPFTLTVSNPTLEINGWAVNAAGDLTLAIGGSTQSQCPPDVSNCPPGTSTVLLASGNTDAQPFAMDVVVPGGQTVFLNPYWDVGYSEAHSASIPPGSLTTGLAAYQGGGFVNLNGNGMGWVACPPTSAAGGDDVWALIGKNSTNAANLGSCYAVNLAVNVQPAGTIGAWQYS